MKPSPPNLEHSDRGTWSRCETWVAWCFVGLCLSVGIHELTNADFIIQDHFYDAATGRWWIDADAPGLRWAFYLFPKWLTISSIIVLGAWLVVDRIRGLHDTPAGRSRWLVLVSLIAIPAAAGLCKKLSGVWCPSELAMYGGEHTFRLLFADRPPGVEIGHNFPGGHASAGFAFLCLCFLPGTSRQRLTRFLFAMALGWSMGTYQMLKGAHFFSHTLTTMFLAGLIAGLLAWFVPLTGREMAAATTDPPCLSRVPTKYIPPRSNSALPRKHRCGDIR